MHVRRAFTATLAATALAVLSSLPGIAAAQSFQLWITETPAGGTGPYNSQFKGGLRSYVFDGLGYTAAHYSTGPTVAANTLNDPSSFAVEAGGSLLVAERGFNTGSGAVSRVTFTGGLPNAPTTVISGIDTGPHQISLTTGGGLVVSSLTSGGKLYPALTTPASVSYASGNERGAVASGNILYSTDGTGLLRTFNVTTGASTGSFGISGAGLLHYGTMFGGALWLADIGSPGGSGGGVYKVTLDGSGTPTASTKVANVDGAISIAFSPSGDEMFVAGHYNGLLSGFAVGAGLSIAASPNLSIDGGTLASWGGAHVAYGGLAVTNITPVPEPATTVLLLAGLATVGAAARRRRS